MGISPAVVPSAKGDTPAVTLHFCFVFWILRWQGLQPCCSSTGIISFRVIPVWSPFFGRSVHSDSAVAAMHASN